MSPQAASALARLDEIPDDHSPGWWDSEARSGGFGTRWHPVCRHFGLQGFGTAGSGADAGQELIVQRDELRPEDPDAPYVAMQQAIYYLVRGGARFVLDGHGVDLTAGDILFEPLQLNGSATASQDHTLVLGVGGAPGQPYRGLDPAEYKPPQRPGSVAARGGEVG